MNKKKYFGVMLDCSRNAVMKPEAVKNFAVLLKKMGYNSVMLYTEDTYAVEGEPYFGYMRGRYTAEEIRSLDAYLKAKGIELIPCIQTLAHFTVPCRNPNMSDMFDYADILMIGEDRTYEFIDRLFKFTADNFTSRNINIGMDEAHMVGLGKYLDKHGYTDRTQLLLSHIEKVAEIARKYGFKPMMWSDMYFRLASKGRGYYCGDIEVEEDVKSKIPDDMSLIYWDYYHSEKSVYDSMINSHLKFGKNVWFAGGAWSWNGFAPFNRLSLKNMLPAMDSVREHGIDNIFITMWGDNGKECSFYALLPSLYKMRKYYEGVTDEEVIKDGFKKLVGIDYDEYMSLDLPNLTDENATDVNTENPCKCLLFDDCFMGKFDSLVQERKPFEYAKFSTIIGKNSKNPKYGYIFDCLSKLCSVLELKYNLGIRTREAYNKGREAVFAIISDYTETVKRLGVFYKSFRKLWMKENKPFGFEIQDARLGGLMQRLKSCAETLKDYANGKIDSIPELEEKLLSANDGHYLANNVYETIISESIL